MLLAALACDPSAKAAGTDTISVELTNFTPEGRDRSADGTIPVRWSASAMPWLQGRESCDREWHHRNLCEDEPEGGLPLHDKSADGAPILVRTCAEWSKALQEGRFAMSTKDMALQSRFVFTDGLLIALANAQPAAMSAFGAFDLAQVARELLPPSPAEHAPTQASGQTAGPPTAPRGWTITGNRALWRDDIFFRWFEPVLFGDLDGDRWEDMLVFSGGGAMHGTYRWYAVSAFTRRDDGTLIDITARLPRGLPSAGDSELGAAWRTSVRRIAPCFELSLDGVCHCSGESHPMRLTAELDDGFLTGSAQCDKMARGLAVVGTLGATKGSFKTRDASGSVACQFSFDWTLQGGSLELKGFRCFEWGIESTEFSLRGEAPTPEKRMRDEGWTSELAFHVADSRLLLRRGCGSLINARPRDALCLDSNGHIAELVRLDRIEWAASARHREDSPASDQELMRSLPACIHCVHDGSTMLLLDGWRFGASTSDPFVIAIPIRENRLMVNELRVFALASIDLRNGIARVLEHDLREGAEPDRDEHMRPPVAREWLGSAWSDE